MADEEEERVVEEQLQFQLQEQKDSLSAVADALSSDPSNAELLSVGPFNLYFRMHVCIRYF